MPNTETVGTVEVMHKTPQLRYTEHINPKVHLKPYLLTYSFGSSRKTECVSIVMTTRLMLFSEITTIYSEVILKNKYFIEYGGTHIYH
jgi:hypothetical protein